MSTPTITNVVAPTSSIVAQSQASNAQRTEPVVTNQTISATVVSQAAVVHLNASSQNRAPSTGSGKHVDASFEKQKAKEKSKESSTNSNSSQSGTLVKVVA